MSVIGAMVDTGQVEQAMLNHLKLWLPRYLAIKDKQDQPAVATSPPKSWDISHVFDESQMPQVPGIQLVSPGIVDPARKLGDGNVIATYEINVAIIVPGPDAMTTNTLKHRYAAAVVACIMQRRSLGDPNVRGTDFLGNEHIELPADERRTRQAIMPRFYVEYEHVLDWRTSPAETVIQDPWPWVPPSDPTVPEEDLGLVEKVIDPVVTVDTNTSG